MRQPTSTLYPISDILEWDYSGQLEIAPRFQRRDVWSLNAKSYLIDTVLRSMPIPPLFIRLKVDPVKRRTIREVVDGQQRLRAVLGFVKGEFSVLKVHNREFAGMSYADLPKEVQSSFLGYTFVTHILQDVSDADVLSIFARMNTYTVKLNAQELRNAEFFGAFKQAVYQLARQHYAFWRNNNILTDRQIARMGEAELVSMLVVSMLDGIRQTKSKDLGDFYKRFDEDFPQADCTIEQFGEVIDIIGNIFKGTLRSSEFRRRPLFYSLFCVVYDAKFGLLKSDRPRLRFTAPQNKSLRKRLHELDEIISMKEPPSEYSQFVQAIKLSTADPGTRRLRHKFLWNKVFCEVA